MDDHETSLVPADGSGSREGTALEPKVFDAEYVTDSGGASDATVPADAPAGWGRLLVSVARTARSCALQLWRSDVVVRARSVAAYRAGKVPADLVRLAWFVTRGHWRWLVKAWSWATYADLRADVRAARLAGDTDARRTAQELIRADAKARWARVGIVLRRAAITARIVGVLAALLWLVAAFLDRADMWPWLAGVYAVIGAVWTVLSTAMPVLLGCLPMVWVIAAAFEGRDRNPGAGWLIQPDRDDADSWIDERMISKALAHLGIGPLKAFFKDGGELAYTVSARKDGDGTYAQVRLPLGVTADMVAAQRQKLAANLGRAGLETWPTKGEEDGILDLWVADKGTLNGGAGDWPLLHEGQVDLFDGVPFGLTQRGMIVNAPLVEANWLVGGRPGQGKSSALRTLLLGAALDPTAELWVFVMGESPDFDPFTPRLSRYRMGMDDAVAEAALQALDDLLSEMERRGRVLGEQPGRPPKVSRKLADKRSLGLHPLVCSIDECHELFQHPKLGKRAAELAVRLIKRGRKYGIVLLLATQSPTKDSIPREVTRNVSCGVAFSVADQVANDGLLGSGKYRAGIRATDLRMHTDRGTCVAVGVTDATFELVRTFYVPFEDEIDDVSPVIARAMDVITESGRAIAADDRAEIEAAPIDHLADIASVLRDEHHVRTRLVLARLIEHNPSEYEGWTARDLLALLRTHGVRPRKLHGGHMHLLAEDLDRAITRRAQGDETGGEMAGEAPKDQGSFPTPSPRQTSRPDQAKHRTGRCNRPPVRRAETPENRGAPPPVTRSLPDPAGGADDR
jgi:S-DNA-T family DNA segregation ATPase FtsK/SpoIIIE